MLRTLIYGFAVYALCKCQLSVPVFHCGRMVEKLVITELNVVDSDKKYT